MALTEIALLEHQAGDPNRSVEQLLESTAQVDFLMQQCGMDGAYVFGNATKLGNESLAFDRRDASYHLYAWRHTVTEAGGWIETIVLVSTISNQLVAQRHVDQQGLERSRTIMDISDPRALERVGHINQLYYERAQTYMLERRSEAEARRFRVRQEYQSNSNPTNWRRLTATEKLPQLIPARVTWRPFVQNAH